MKMRGREEERSRQGPYFGGNVDQVKYKGNYEIKLLSISSFSEYFIVET